MLTNQTRASLVYFLQSLSKDAVRLLLLKHFDRDLQQDTESLLSYTAFAQPERMASLLTEILVGSTALRTDAPQKFVYEGRLAELRSRLKADGYELAGESLIRTIPTAEPTATISDELETSISASELDLDGEIGRLLRDSYANISSAAPDYNGGTTKVRIALECVARRSAIFVARKRGVTPPTDTWGSALSFLRSQSVIAHVEEEALAKTYTLISGGAHVPKGLTDEQWALLSRTFALAGIYFLVRQHNAA